MSCSCCEPDKTTIHKKTLNIKGYFNEMVNNQKLHPGEYWNNPIVKREISNGIEMLKKRNPDLINVNIMTDFTYFDNEQVLYFQI